MLSVPELDSLRQRNIQVAALHSQVSHVEQGQVCLLFFSGLHVLMSEFEIKKQLQDYDTKIKLLYGALRFCRLRYVVMNISRHSYSRKDVQPGVCAAPRRRI